MNIYLQGLFISLVGMTATFTALGVVIFIIIGLKKLFPWKPEVEEGSEEESEEEAPVVFAESTPEANNQAVVAAIVAALEYFRSQSNLGNALNEGRGSWWISRRMSSNQSITQKK